MNIINKIFFTSIGILLGILLSQFMKPNLKIHNYNANFTSGAGDFPKEAYQKINSEVINKFRQLTKEEGEIQIAVTPNYGGYTVNIAARSDSKVWEKEVAYEIDSWIEKSLFQAKYKELEHTEQKGPR